MVTEPSKALSPKLSSLAISKQELRFPEPGLLGCWSTNSFKADLPPRKMAGNQRCIFTVAAAVLQNAPALSPCSVQSSLPTSQSHT